MVTIRSSSSEVRSPARLVRSTSAFLQTKLEYRRPTPVILVKAYMTFCFPSTFVFNKRMMYWKLWQVSIAVRTRIIVKMCSRRATRRPAPRVPRRCKHPSRFQTVCYPSNIVCLLFIAHND